MANDSPEIQIRFLQTQGNNKKLSQHGIQKKSSRLPKKKISTLWHPRHPWQRNLHRTDPLISEVACEWVEDELLAQGLGRNLAEMLPKTASVWSSMFKLEVFLYVMYNIRDTKSKQM